MNWLNFLGKSKKAKSEPDNQQTKQPGSLKDAAGCLIMPKPKIANYREFLILGYDGNQRRIYASDEEVMFPDGCLITSKTDLNGVITHANESFVTMSGWQRQEIISQTHNVLRHPDMPSAVFEEMWATIKKGEKWHGYMKNLRKDSSFYWVYATVIPNIRHDVFMGYTSVRGKPSREKIIQAEQLYQTMLSEEKNQTDRLIRIN